MRFHIERIAQNDLAGISEAAGITWHVWERMEHKEWYAPDEIKVISRRLHGGEGFVYRAVEAESGETAGVFIVIIPGITKENLGNDAGFDRELLGKTAHMDSAAILPKFRGYALQQRLAEAAEAELLRLGYHILMCTVHPDNCFSRSNMLKQGYRVIGAAEKYGGHRREILMKELSGSRSASDEKHV